MLLENKCRTCYRDVTTDESYVLTPLQDDSQTLSNLASKLKECVPEIELGAMQEEKICWTCCVTLDKTYEFRVTCLQTNEKFVSINNLHTDIDLVKTEVEDAIDIKQENVDVLANDEPFEENEVIKGDISVGFEITKAKDAHNTVSVSITTSGTEIKTFNKTHSFPNPFSTESAKLIVSDAFVDKISDGVNEIQSKFKIDCVVDKAIDDAVDYSNCDDEQVKCDLRVQPLANQVSETLKQKRSVYICTFCDAIFSTRIKWKKHIDVHKRKRRVSKHRHKNEPETKLNTDRNSDRKPRLILKSETVTRSKSLGLAESRTRRKAVANAKPMSKLDVREIKRHNTRNANAKMFTNKTATNEPTPKAKAIAVNKTKRKSDPANKPKIKVEAIKPPDITCVFCKINFHSVNIYNIHMKFIHKNEIANVENVVRTNNADLSCTKCGKVFESRQQLDAHVKSHVNRQPAVTPKYNCWFCGDDLYSQQGFAGHSARHRHHKKCKFCSEEFTHMTQYLQHQPCAKEKQIKTKGKMKAKTKSTVVSDVVKKNTRNNILESTLSTKSLKRKITTRSSKTKLVEDAPLNPPKRAKTEVDVSSKPSKYNNHVVRTRSRSHKAEFVLSSSNVETITPAPEGAKLEILKPLDSRELVVDESVRRDRKNSPIVSHFEEIESNKRRAQSKMNFVKVDEDPAKDTTLPVDVRESTDRNELPMSVHFEEIESNKRRTNDDKVNDVDPAKDTTLLLDARESTELASGHKETIADVECNLTRRPNSRNSEQQTSNPQSCSDEIEPKTYDTNKTSMPSSDLVTSKDHSESPNVADEHVTSDKRTVDNGECNSLEAVLKITENVADVPKICQFCSLSFDTTACLKAHVCLGSGMELDQMYRCTICRTLFVGQEAFIGHTNSVHSGSFS